MNHSPPVAEGQPENQSVASLFAVPDYRRGWLLGLFTGVIRWLEFLALGIFAYQLTESAPLVALLAIVRIAPYALLGFVVGALTDRYDRKLLFMLGLAVMITMSALMTYLSFTGQASYPLILATTLATGIFWLTDMPIRRRFMVDAVGSERVGRAMGIDSITNYGTRGLGPLTGGLLLQAFGATGVFAFNFVLYVVCFLLVLGFKRKEARTDAGDESGQDHAPPRTLSLLSNSRFVIILGITVVYNLFCNPFVAMIPVFTSKDFGLSPAAIGTLASFEGLGGVIGAVLIGVYIRQQQLFAVYYFGPFLYLAALLGLSYLMQPETTFLALVVASFGGGCFSGTQYALIYMTAPAELRGRAFGLLALCIGCATLGLWNAGYLFDHYTSSYALRIMAAEGVICMALLGLAALLTKPQPIRT